MMVLMMVSQSVVSAAVSYSMTMGSSTTAMNDGNRSCHDEKDLVVDTKGDNALIDQSLEMTSDDSSNCCDVDCHCPSGHCSSAALPQNIMPNGRLHSISQNIENSSQWIVSQYPPSLYRPPISF